MSEHSQRQLLLVDKQLIIKEEPEDEIDIKLETEVYISDMEFEDDSEFQDFGDNKNVEISDETDNILIEGQETIVSELCSKMQGDVEENQLHDASLSIQAKSSECWPSNDCLELYMKLIKKNITSYTCKICFFKHETLNVMKKHCKQHIQFDQNEKSSYIICDRCDKRFKHMNHLYRHVNSTHIKKYEFCCSKCDKTFTRKDVLQTHISFIHNKRRNRKGIKKEIKHKYNCSICMRSFQRDHSLQRHMVEVHQGLKHICDYATSNSPRRRL